MRERNYDELVATLVHDHVVWETSKDETLCAALSRDARHSRERDYLVFKKVERRIHRALELCPKSRTLQFVPRGCFDGFFGCLIENADSTH